MREFKEAHRKIGDPEDRFDLEYWQALGPEAIFEAALEMALDVERVKSGHAVEPRLQRTIEAIHRS